MQLPGTILDLDQPQLSFGEMSQMPSPVWQIDAFLNGMEPFNSSVDQLFYQPCHGPRSVATTVGREDDLFEQQPCDEVHCAVMASVNIQDEPLSRNVEHSINDMSQLAEGSATNHGLSPTKEEINTRRRRHYRRDIPLQDSDDAISLGEEQEFKVKPNNKSSNETKNIPKNFGKAIISFILRNRLVVQRLLGSLATFEEFLAELRPDKRRVNTIADLRTLWLTGRFGRELRVLSNLFLRKHALTYIFSGRVTNQGTHIKYRERLREALKDPHGFTNIKDH